MTRSLLPLCCLLALSVGVCAGDVDATQWGWADKFIIGTSNAVLNSNGTGMVWADSPFDGGHSYSDIGYQNRTQAYNARTQVGWHHASRSPTYTTVLQTFMWRYRSPTGGYHHSWGDLT